MYSQLLCATLGRLAADADLVVAFLAVTPLSDLPVAEDEAEDAAAAAAAADLFREGVPEEGGEGGPDVLPLVTGRGDPTTATFRMV